MEGTEGREDQNYLIGNEPDKPFKCEDEKCNFSTNKETALRYHKLVIHQKVVRFLCSLCPYSTFYKHSVDHHIKFNHPGLEPRALKINCSLCQQGKEHGRCESSTTERKQGRVRSGGGRKERKERKSRTTRETQCPECESVFPNQSLRRKHLMARHPGKTIFQCSHCDYGSNYLANLEDHVQSLHEQKVRVCDLCGFTASWSKTFHQHRRDRHGLRLRQNWARSTCEVCGRRVARLAKHMRAHQMCLLTVSMQFPDSNAVKTD